MRYLYTLAMLLGLSGCAGSAYQLPPVSNTDIQAMEKKIAANDKPLKTYARSDQHYKKTVATITKRLTKNALPLCEYSGYQSCYFDVTYNPEETVNAYASEGYKITVYKGLLQYLSNNDEIAAVIGHEMGHHLAKHNEETMQNAAAGAAVSGVLTAILIGAAGANATYSPYQQQQNQRTIENMMKAGAHIGALSYSKEQEREADLLATYLLSRAGYNLERAQNIMVVLSKFAGEKDPSRAAFLDSHPAGMERVVAWEKAISEIQTNDSKLPYAIGKPKGSIEAPKKEE